MEPTAMNDEFLRRLRPMPRAAFVHELKGRLDRQPRAQSLSGAPAYLRTLLVALLIGGAAFAVTMISGRREPVGAQTSVPAAQSLQVRAEATAPVTRPVGKAAAEALSPVTPHATRREVAPAKVGVTSSPQESRASDARAATGGAAIPDASTPRVTAGLAIGPARLIVEGAGGSAASPVFDAWSSLYRAATGVDIDYVSMAQGGALKLLQNRKITFAVIDLPRPAEELKASGLLQFPIFVQGVVPVAHLAGIKASQITLDTSTLAGIYSGEISRWSDPRIAALNPRITLPTKRITLVYRSDASATTNIFTGTTDQLDISPGMAARGNDGMADLVERTDGAIGYMDYAYARAKGIDSIRLFNREGKAVSATPETLQAHTWPLTGASHVVLYGQFDKPGTAAALQFFDWVYREGSKTATELGYVPLSQDAADQVRSTWK